MQYMKFETNVTINNEEIIMKTKTMKKLVHIVFSSACAVVMLTGVQALAKDLDFKVIANSKNYENSPVEKLVALLPNMKPVSKVEFGVGKKALPTTVVSNDGIWLFSKNNNYVGGNELKQQPLFTAKLHIIRKLPKNMWISANMGYGVGGKAYVNGIPRDSHISAARFGFHYAIPFDLKHSIKIGVITGICFEKGNDFDAFTISYQYRWNKSVQKYLKNITQ